MSPANRTFRRRILVLANETVAAGALREVVGLRGAGEADVVVVAPALTGRLGYWTGDNRRSRQDAEERLGVCLDSLRESGVAARGKVGDADPLQALEDALREFDADEIIVATRPESRSNWRASDIVGRARRRFSRPISQIAA
jgi:hypothetical protein